MSSQRVDSEVISKTTLGNAPSSHGLVGASARTGNAKDDHAIGGKRGPRSAFLVVDEQIAAHVHVLARCESLFQPVDQIDHDVAMQIALGHRASIRFRVLNSYRLANRRSWSFSALGRPSSHSPFSTPESCGTGSVRRCRAAGRLLAVAARQLQRLLHVVPLDLLQRPADEVVRAAAAAPPLDGRPCGRTPASSAGRRASVRRRGPGRPCSRAGSCSSRTLPGQS